MASRFRFEHRHCEPTGSAQSGRPDDKLREAIEGAIPMWIASLFAMTNRKAATSGRPVQWIVRPFTRWIADRNNGSSK
jgi:hypothetical protein